MKTISSIPASKPIGYADLRKQLNDYTSTFYGPSCCDGCGRYDVVRKNYEEGADSWESFESKTGTTYEPHHCSHVIIFKRLVGKVLTVLDAALSTNPAQHKAVKDLVKQSFAESIARARMLEGDTGAESTASLEQLATC